MEPTDDRQQLVLHKLHEGKNVFMTGSAGTGKSYTIQQVLSTFAEKVLYITALTGCAAILLGKDATTIHSFAGIGLGEKSIPELIEKIKKNKDARKRWKQVELLIIDEISMMSEDLLIKLDAIAKAIRKSTVIFGGIQLLLSGDFFQLPPIHGRFVFESQTWNNLDLEKIELITNHRQKDHMFQKILDEARVGKLSSESITILQSRARINWKSLPILPTLLFPKNNIVDNINQTKLKQLEGPFITYQAKTRGICPADRKKDLDWEIQHMDKSFAYCPQLILAKHAQVMLTYNLDIKLGLINGSRGVIVGFINGFPEVQFASVKIVIDNHDYDIKDFPGMVRSQLPLKLAYALSIHKVEGMSLDCALIDIGTDIFEYGQAYVALSRVRKIESLYIYRFDPISFRAHPKVYDYYYPSGSKNNM